jgi:hypothetical protein
MTPDSVLAAACFLLLEIVVVALKTPTAGQLVERLHRLKSQKPIAPRRKISTATTGIANGVMSATGSAAGAAVGAGVGSKLAVATGVANVTADASASFGDGDGVGVGDGNGVGDGVGDGSRTVCRADGVAVGLVVGVGVGSGAAAGHRMTNITTPGKSLAENDAFVPSDPTRVALIPRCVVNRSPACSAHPRAAADGAV